MAWWQIVLGLVVAGMMLTRSLLGFRSIGYTWLQSVGFLLAITAGFAGFMYLMFLLQERFG